MDIKNKKGFTLLETLIALSITVIGALGVFSLMQRTALVTRFNKQSIITVNLAREGLGLVRSLRDTTSVGFAGLVNGNWVIDSSINYSISLVAENSNIASCNNCRLYMTNGQYSHNLSSNQTGYSRLINISDGTSFACGGTCEKVITVYVLQPGASRAYTLTEHLTDWR